MSTGGLKTFIETLERENELVRVKEFVDPDLEITEITDRFSKQKDGGKALLFENNGTGFPLLINALGSEKRMALAFGRPSVYALEKEIEDLIANLMQPRDHLWDKLKILPRLKEVARWMPRKLNRKGKCQEIVMDAPDLFALPVLTCWPADGGRFITLPAVHTMDPVTKMPNVGMYRMQVFQKDLTGMHWHKHKTGAAHFEKYKKEGKKMPVSVALGGDPVYTYAATAPMPENVDEYLLAGFLRKKPVKLVKCLTNNLYVPEDADFIIEGFVDPEEPFILEGPFGDHTGFYSLADHYPKFHVTCITHRKKAVYPATIVGIPPMEDAWIGKATERIFLTPIRMSMVPELKDMELPFAGVAHNLTIAKITKSYPGQAVKVMHSLWGAGQMMFNKILIVVDDEADIHDPDALMKVFSNNFHPDYSLHFAKGPLDILDHASRKFAFGSKLGIDLTTPLPEEVPQDSIREEPDAIFREESLSRVPGITGWKYPREDLLLPLLLITVKKNKDYSKDKFLSNLIQIPGLSRFKVILIFDEGAPLNDLFTLVWLVGGNLEPLRDISVIKAETGHPVVVTDATFKTLEHDQFKRDWPNVVTMDEKTIKKVDEKWKALGLGAFTESPSLKYFPLVEGPGAVKESH